MSRLRLQQNYSQYRRVSNLTPAEAVAEAAWINQLKAELGVTEDLETARQVFSEDELFIQGFFVDSGHSMVVEPHWYDEDDNLLTVGEKITLTPTADSSDSRDLGDGGGAAAYFPSPFDYLVNPAAKYLRIKVTTLPAGLAGIFLGGRA